MVNDGRGTKMNTRKAAKKGGQDTKTKKDFKAEIHMKDKDSLHGVRSGGCIMCGGCQITGCCMLES